MNWYFYVVECVLNIHLTGKVAQFMQNFQFFFKFGTDLPVEGSPGSWTNNFIQANLVCVS
ncbi:hypothetical protein ACX27_17020 [Nostoc piscinale CENA21]|uniref:Uncharacterized protein n=1 Tax=Nostoc piscinale CENA21 TaxID=224013 RepID=A0A0M3V5M0_9NOSO|nr:hypothetical protein ACX27_17020 [Nostoc piscinale CENA21]